MAKDYRELDVWRKAIDLCTEIYRLTQARPADERFGLTQQIRRAAVSVPSNIAEGEGRGNDREFVQFLRIARGSLREVETQMVLAHRFGYVDTSAYRQCFHDSQEVARMINGLIRHLRDGPP